MSWEQELTVPASSPLADWLEAANHQDPRGRVLRECQLQQGRPVRNPAALLSLPEALLPDPRPRDRLLPVRPFPDLPPEHQSLAHFHC